MTSLPDTVASLRAAVADRDETVAQLRAVIAPVVSFAAVGRFTPCEETILSALFEREIATFEALYQALFAGRYGRETPDDNIVKVHLCRIRHKLARHGIAIENGYGRGYRMAPDAKARLRSLMAKGDDHAAS